MKKRIFTIIAIMALGLMTACGSGKSDKKASGTELANPTTYDKPGYSIDVSENWAKTNNENADLAFFYKSSENDSFTESINVMTQDLSSYDYTLDTYKDLTVSQYEELSYTIENCDKVTIDGTDCYKITSYTKNDDTKICCTQVFTLMNNTAYLFTFAAEESDYKNLSDEVDAMFETIKFDAKSTESSSEETSVTPDSSDNSDISDSSESSESSENPGDSQNIETSSSDVPTE